ncbi:unnamed protein product [Acanthosepion pharaonis]|uniref:Uncharacterized protein n=1 Tax=Acanthosepion pharaonis TaxID=158019 RepID=A0A812CVX0_ACAPH|nr:unnamed protein product [Sepia pharaonis]
MSYILNLPLELKPVKLSGRGGIYLKGLKYKLIFSFFSSLIFSTVSFTIFTPHPHHFPPFSFFISFTSNFLVSFVIAFLFHSLLLLFLLPLFLFHLPSPSLPLSAFSLLSLSPALFSVFGFVFRPLTFYCRIPSLRFPFLSLLFFHLVIFLLLLLFLSFSRLLFLPRLRLLLLFLLLLLLYQLFLSFIITVCFSSFFLLSTFMLFCRKV